MGSRVQECVVKGSIRSWNGTSLHKDLKSRDYDITSRDIAGNDSMFRSPSTIRMYVHVLGLSNVLFSEFLESIL